jgi:putative DNA primase/helicase
MTLTELLSRLEGVRKSGAGYVARCPAHDDQKASLSLKEGEDRRLLLWCHAGCETRNVLAARGLSMRDLYPDLPQELPRAVRRETRWVIQEGTPSVNGVTRFLLEI